MKATLCDINKCREDAHGVYKLDYFGTPGVFHHEGYLPKESIIVLEEPYTSAKYVDNVQWILNRPFDLCYKHLVELFSGKRIRNYWVDNDKNVQDERFVIHEESIK